MTKIKMNDGVTEYDAKENLSFIKELIFNANLHDEKLIEITMIKMEPTMTTIVRIHLMVQVTP